MVTIWKNKDLNTTFVVDGKKALPAKSFVYDPCDNTFAVGDKWTVAGATGSLFYSGGTVYNSFNWIGSIVLTTKDIIGANSFSVQFGQINAGFNSGTVPAAIFDVLLVEGTTSVSLGSIYRAIANSTDSEDILIATLNVYQDSTNVKSRLAHFEHSSLSRSYNFIYDVHKTTPLGGINVSTSKVRFIGYSPDESGAYFAIKPILLGRRTAYSG